jgi:hypothetical protein
MARGFFVGKAISEHQAVQIHLAESHRQGFALSFFSRRRYLGQLKRDKPRKLLNGVLGSLAHRPIKSGHARLL